MEQLTLDNVVTVGLACGMMTIAEAYVNVMMHPYTFFDMHERDAQIQTLHEEMREAGIILGGEKYDWVDPSMSLRSIAEQRGIPIPELLPSFTGDVEEGQESGISTVGGVTMTPGHQYPITVQYMPDIQEYRATCRDWPDIVIYDEAIQEAHLQICTVIEDLQKVRSAKGLDSPLPSC